MGAIIIKVLKVWDGFRKGSGAGWQGGQEQGSSGVFRGSWSLSGHLQLPDGVVAGAHLSLQVRDCALEGLDPFL